MGPESDEDLPLQHGKPEISEKALKAAQTRAENRERERREDEQRAKETEGGRQAKRRAQNNAVWKTTLSTAKQTSSSKDSNARKLERHAEPVGRPEVPLRGRRTSQSKGDKQRDGSGRERGRRGHQGGHHRSSKDQNNNDDSDGLSDRRACHNERKKRKIRARSFSHSSSNRSGDNSDSNDGGEFQSDKSLGSASESGEDMSDVNEELERPVFPAARDLFSVDNVDVVMNSRSRSSSRSAAYPSTTDDDDIDIEAAAAKSSSSDINKSDHHLTHKRSSGRRAAYIPTDDEEEHSMSASESRAVSSGKGHGRLEKRFNDERPHVQPPREPIKKKAKPSSDTAGPNEVSPAVRINHEGKGKVKLLDQPITVQEVVREGIDRATEDVVLRKSWPEEKVRPTYGRDQLIEACRSPALLKSHDRHHLEELRSVLKKDARVAKLLGSVVTARLSLVRAPAKVEASKAVPYYQLGLGTDCEDRVRSLMTNLVFHMPGSWGGVSMNEWQPNSKEAFLSPSVIKTIKAAYFTSHQAIGRRFEDKFTSGLPSVPDEKELPISLLALGMTAVYCALYEFRNGHKENAEFDGQTFLSVNQDIVALLERLQTDKPIEFHNRMHKLYTLVSDTSTNAPVLHTGAYTVIEL